MKQPRIGFEMLMRGIFCNRHDIRFFDIILW